MSIILCLETSGKNCSVALFKEGVLIGAKEVVTEQFSHSENLHVFIEEVLKECAIAGKSVSAIAISAGPGSYTGLRIGTATAKGLCYGWGIPLIALPTLRILAGGAAAHLADISYIIPMIDARRMEVFTAVYAKDFSLQAPTVAKILDENSFSSYLAQGKVLFLGDGSSKFAKICQHPNAAFLEVIYPSATQMGSLAAEKYEQQAFEDIAYFEPFYLKEAFVNDK